MTEDSFWIFTGALTLQRHCSLCWRESWGHPFHCGLQRGWEGREVTVLQTSRSWLYKKFYGLFLKYPTTNSKIKRKGEKSKKFRYKKLSKNVSGNNQRYSKLGAKVWFLEIRNTFKIQTLQPRAAAKFWWWRQRPGCSYNRFRFTVLTLNSFGVPPMLQNLRKRQMFKFKCFLFFFFPGGTDASATPPRILLKMHFGKLNLITTPATVILIGPKYTSATLPRIPRDISDALWEL